MGWDGDKMWRETIGHNELGHKFNRCLFTETLIPRLQGLGLISPQVERRYRKIGLLD